MRIRVFTAPRMADAMAMVRSELGADAVILGSRRTSAGMEVTAALEAPEPVAVVPPVDGVPPAYPSPVAVVSPTVAAPLTYPNTAIWPPGSISVGLPPAALGTVAPVPLGTVPRAAFPAAAAPPDVALPAAVAPAAVTPVAAPLAVPASARPQRAATAPAVATAPAAVLARHGLPPQLAARFEEGDTLAALLERRLGFGLLPDATQRPLLLAGPCGAGKSLTCAKLAARAVLRGGGVAPLVVTADGQRAGATEQLAAFTRVLGAPLVSAPDPASVAAAVARRLEQGWSAPQEASS